MQEAMDFDDEQLELIKIAQELTGFHDLSELLNAALRSLIDRETNRLAVLNRTRPEGSF